MKIPEFIISDKVVCNIKKLYPRHEVYGRIHEYYSSKIKLIELFIVAGIIILTAFQMKNNTHVIENGKIKRNSYGEGDKIVNLKYEVEGNDTCDLIGKDVGVNGSSLTSKDENEGEIEFKIREKRYNTTQICSMIEKFKDNLIKTIISDNESLDYVTDDLSFVHELAGYPFSVDYITDKPQILTRDGKILKNNVTADGEDVIVTANIKYLDYEEELMFAVCIYKNTKLEKETYSSIINEIIDLEDKKSQEMDYFALPSEIRDKKVYFYEKNDNYGFVVVAFLILSAVVIFYGKDKDLEKEVEKRDAELRLEYPRFINRFTLFYTAGIPIRQIFIKMCKEYEEEKDKTGEHKFLYEEILYICNLLSEGEREEEAYEELSRRVSLAQYKTFIGLIIQDLRNGKRDLSLLLRKEAQDSFTEKVNNSKKLLEEASTKLLAPMFMMLIVVMVIIMFPAFSSFK